MATLLQEDPQATQPDASATIAEQIARELDQSSAPPTAQPIASGEEDSTLAAARSIAAQLHVREPSMLEKVVVGTAGSLASAAKFPDLLLREAEHLGIPGETLLQSIPNLKAGAEKLAGIGQQIQDAADYISPPGSRPEGFLGNLPYDVGGFLPLLASSAIGGEALAAAGAPLRIGQAIGSAGMGAAQVSVPMYHDILAATGDESKALTGAAIGMGVGALQAKGVGGILSKLEEATGGGVMRYLTQVATGAVEQGAVQATQQALLDAARTHLTGEDMSYLDRLQRTGRAGVFGLLFGGIVGGALHGLHAAGEATGGAAKPGEAPIKQEAVSPKSTKSVPPQSSAPPAVAEAPEVSRESLGQPEGPSSPAESRSSPERQPSGAPSAAAGTYAHTEEPAANSSVQPTDTLSKVELVPIDQPKPFNPRNKVEEAKVEELMAKMKAGEPLPPLIVSVPEPRPDQLERPVAPDDHLVIDDGQHRLEAARRLGFTEVPVRVAFSAEQAKALAPAVPPESIQLETGKRLSVPIVSEGKRVGSVLGQVTQDAVHVFASRIEEEHRGQGLASKAYEAIARKTLESGRQLWSDNVVSVDAARVYEALERKGFHVERAADVRRVEKPPGERSEMGPALVARGPVFRVTEGPAAQGEPGPGRATEAPVFQRWAERAARETAAEGLADHLIDEEDAGKTSPEKLVAPFFAPGGAFESMNEEGRAGFLKAIEKATGATSVEDFRSDFVKGARFEELKGDNKKLFGLLMEMGEAQRQHEAGTNPFTQRAPAVEEAPKQLHAAPLSPEEAASDRILRGEHLTPEELAQTPKAIERASLRAQRGEKPRAKAKEKTEPQPAEEAAATKRETIASKRAETLARRHPGRASRAVPFEVGADRGTVRLNHEADRLQLFFDQPPGNETRRVLRDAGFKWVPTVGAWQRQWTLNAELATERLLGVPINEKTPGLRSEPWEMTRAEWDRAYGAARAETFGPSPAKASAGAEVARIAERERLRFGAESSTNPESEFYGPVTHRRVIEKALAEGLPVPERVLAEYPDLAPAAKPAPTPPVPLREVAAPAGQPAPIEGAEQPSRAPEGTGGPVRSVPPELAAAQSPSTEPKPAATLPPARDAAATTEPIKVEGVPEDVPKDIREFSAFPGGLLDPVLREAGKLIQRFRRTPPLQTGPEPVPTARWTEKAIQNYVDYFEPVQRIERAVAGERRPGEAELPDLEDAYLQETLRRGKTLHGTRGLLWLEREHQKPTLQLLRSSRISMDEADEFLMARNAHAGNAIIAKRNPDNPELTRYGMTDDEASAILTRVQADPRAAAFQQLGERFDRLTRDTLERHVASGRMTQETMDRLIAEQPHYAPARTDMSGPNGEPIQVPSGARRVGQAVKTALGRTSRADTPLAFQFTLAQQAIVQGEMNLVRQSFAHMVAAYQHEIGDAARIVEVPMHRVLGSDGVAREVFDPYFRGKQNVVIAWDKGRPIAVEIAPEHADLARALNQLGPAQVEGVGRLVAQFNRIRSGLITRYRPFFWPFNLIRDVKSATYLGSEFGARFAARTVADVPKALLTLAGKDTSLTPMLQRYREAGAPVSFLELSGLQSQLEDMQKALDDPKTSTGDQTLEGFRRIKAAMNAASDIGENATRFAAFTHAVQDLGWTDARAAAYAKELQNFERKGINGNAVNAWYLFANAGIQSSRRFLQAMRHPAVRRMAAASFVAAMSWDQLQRHLGGKAPDGKDWWDKIPDYEKQANFIFMYPDGSGRRVNIPAPFMFGSLNYTGEQLAAALSGHIKPGEFMASSAAAWVNSVNPFGNIAGEDGSGVFRALTPDIARLPLEIATNRDWRGKPIYPEKGKGPDTEAYWPDVNPTAKAVAQWLGSATGGDRYEPGAIDVSPETLQHVAEYFGSGLPQDVVSVVGTARKLQQGEPVPGRDVPLLKRILREPSVFSSWSEQADLLNTLKAEQARLKADHKGLPREAMTVLHIGEEVSKERDKKTHPKKGTPIDALPEGQRQAELQKLDIAAQAWNKRAREALKKLGR